MYVIPKNTKIFTCSHCDRANTATLALCPFLSEPAHSFLVHFSAVQLSCASARAALSHLQSQGAVGEKAVPRGGERTGDLPHTHGIKGGGKCSKTPLVFQNLSQVEAFQGHSPVTQGR